MYLAIAVTFLANELIIIVFPFIKRSLYKDVLAGMCVCVCGAGGGGLFKKVLYGEAPLRGPTPYPLMDHF